MINEFVFGPILLRHSLAGSPNVEWGDIRLQVKPIIDVEFRNMCLTESA